MHVLLCQTSCPVDGSILGLFHFIGPANAYTHTLSIHSCTMLYVIDYIALLKVYAVETKSYCNVM